MSRRVWLVVGAVVVTIFLADALLRWIARQPLPCDVVAGCVAEPERCQNLDYEQHVDRCYEELVVGRGS